MTACLTCLPLQSVTKTAMSAMSLLLSMSTTAISIDDPEKEGGGRPIAFLVFRPMEDPVSSP